MQRWGVGKVSGLVVLLGAMSLACGTGSTAAAVTAAAAQEDEPPRDPDALPKSLDRLKLSAKQQDQVKALIADLKNDLAPAAAKNDVFREAMVSATYRCSADDSRLHIEANRMVEAGNQGRPHVLDAINDFHAVLTPKQRALLVDPILEGDMALGEDTEDGREEGLGKLAEKLDLDFIQKVELIKRAVTRLTVTTSETRELREQALVALRAFKQPQFNIREHAIAEAPVLKLYTRFVLDIAQVVLPVLTEDQCKTGAGLLRRLFKNNDKRNGRKPQP